MTRGERFIVPGVRVRQGLMLANGLRPPGFLFCFAHPERRAIPSRAETSRSDPTNGPSLLSAIRALNS